MNITQMGATALSEEIRTKKITSAHVMEAVLDRIAAVDGDVNAVVSMRSREDLIEEARTADRTDPKGWLGDWGRALPFEPGGVTLCETAPGNMGNLGWDVRPAALGFSSDALFQNWIDLRNFAIGGGFPRYTIIRKSVNF